MFNTDNLLYITLGDGGDAGDPFGNAQNKQVAQIIHENLGIKLCLLCFNPKGSFTRQQILLSLKLFVF